MKNVKNSGLNNFKLNRADILAMLYFYRTEEGGRKYPIKREYSEYFGCPVAFDKSTKQMNDCRIYLPDNCVINPGDIHLNMPISFLAWELVKPLISIGKKFYLWGGRYIGEGVVEAIFFV